MDTAQNTREVIADGLRTAQAGFAHWRKGNLTTHWSEPNFENSEAYKRAMAEVRTFTPNEAVDLEQYDWVVDYARDQYARLQQSFQYLDEKADAIIKYLGGGGAAVTVGALATAGPNPGNVYLPLLFMPTFIFGVIAIFAALQVSSPKQIPAPPLNSICY